MDFAPDSRAAQHPALPASDATAGYRTTYFSESLADDLKTQIEVPITRNYGDMRLEVVGPVLSRVFNPQNAIAERMKHVVEPNFSVQHRTNIANQDRIPRTSGAYDIIIGGTTQMNYGLTNRLLVRKDAAGEPQAGAPRELLSVSMRQTYYTNAEASTFDTSYHTAWATGTRMPSPSRSTRARRRQHWQSTIAWNTTRCRWTRILRSCSA